MSNGCVFGALPGTITCTYLKTCKKISLAAVVFEVKVINLYSNHKYRDIYIDIESAAKRGVKRPVYQWVGSVYP